MAAAIALQLAARARGIERSPPVVDDIARSYGIEPVDVQDVGRTEAGTAVGWALAADPVAVEPPTGDPVGVRGFAGDAEQPTTRPTARARAAVAIRVIGRRRCR